ncbi:SPW repeat domain-containing protein [Mucilaginibacter aquariorum]|uniref:SPW repeat-containing integral membrane domain-containing protein n=1 Tax=Mucilaginibacter aquariorum TaxID=2967225 RepID=A0ABT1SXG2_9SPHI|nr:hypothetical protein [Mucilaginibacter aquariorum]MCQ6957048.1 hypothetical protein [Mucilaginibacter aquariorum]
MKGFLPISFHSVLDYVLATITAASPWLFGFSATGGASLFIPLFIGCMQWNMIIFTNYKFGIWQVFPLQLHLIFDFICGFLIFSAAFIYHYEGLVFWSQVCLGIVNMVFGIFTAKTPFLNNKVDVFDSRGM